MALPSLKKGVMNAAHPCTTYEGKCPLPPLGEWTLFLPHLPSKQDCA